MTDTSEKTIDIEATGAGCRHLVDERCLYQERLNPGYASHWRCAVLQRWETAYDEFLARAERMGVASDDAPELWERQFQRLAHDVFRCSDYAFCHNEEAPACAHCLAGVCLLQLPACEGRCRHFERGTAAEKTTDHA